MKPISSFRRGLARSGLAHGKAARLTVILVIAVVTLSYVARAGSYQTQRAAGNAQEPRKATSELKEAAVESPEPKFPLLAQAARVEGVVEVEISIDPEGRVNAARAISGHPLLKSSAVDAARKWRFDPVKLAAISGDSARTLVFVFDLERELRKRKPIEGTRATATPGVAQLHMLCRAEIARKSPNNERLSLWLARLAVGVANDGLDEALKLFDEVSGQGKLPAAAKPYYAKLMFDKYLIGQSQQAASEERRDPSDGSLSKALEMFIEAYNDELGKGPTDARKLADIGWCIGQIYRVQGKSEEYCDSLKSVLNILDLSEGLRARISYELGVEYWKRAYELTARYVTRNQPVPEDVSSAIRPWVAQGHFCIQTAQNLAPDFANSWFYEKLLALQEFYIESDPNKKKLLQQRALEAQDHYLRLTKQKADVVILDKDEPHYTSGLPPLGVTRFIGVPHPPPPPPPPARPRSNRE
jgi:TonB family protein